MTTGTKEKKVYLPWEEDEKVVVLANQYEVSKRLRDEEEARRSEAIDSLKDIMQSRISEDIDLNFRDSPDGMEVGPKGKDGKKPVLRRTISERKTLSVEKLLEKGVPSAIIDMCTERKDQVSWRIDWVK